ncbi:MAG: hypothetical protein K9G33_08355 [Sneathiella sp.]|nr:hypothetical protein [Sneathiella sp.]
MKKLIPVFAFLFLAACTIEEPPINYNDLNQGDKTASCQDLQEEYAANTDRASALYGGNKAGYGKANDLIDRNISVQELAERKGCDTVLWPDQPRKQY